MSPAARRWLAVAVAAGFVAAVLLIVQAWLLAGVIAAVFRLGADLAEVRLPLALMLGMTLLRAGAIWLGDRLGQQAAIRVKQPLRADLTAHLMALGPSFTLGERSGELVSTAVDGVEALDAYVAEYLPARYLAGLVPLAVLGAVFLIDPWSTLVLLFAGPMLILLLSVIGGRARELSEQRFVELGWLSAHFLDMLRGLPTLKLFGRSREQADSIAVISRHYGETTMQVLATAFQTSLMMEWAATAATAMVALEVSLRLMNGALGYQHALAVLLLTPEFFMPLRQLALRYHAGSAGKAAAERIRVLMERPIPACPPLLSPAPARRVRGSGGEGVGISFDHVSFTYPARGDAEGETRPALRDLTLDLPAGRSLALVGPTGAGKTTVASLLLRFVEPDAGIIRADNAPLAELDAIEWRRCVAWVPQRPHLFHGTVADNLRLGRADADMPAIEAAARAAHAHEFIARLPRGYDTPLGDEGARLSGGERQRLAIARAFLKDAPVLVLDEATAHLDEVSEALVLDALDRLRQGRTVLAIAHRPSLARRADQIAVLDGGRVVETGDHATLLAAGGLYAQLVVGTEEAG